MEVGQLPKVSDPWEPLLYTRPNEGAGRLRAQRRGGACRGLYKWDSLAPVPAPEGQAGETVCKAAENVEVGPSGGCPTKKKRATIAHLRANRLLRLSVMASAKGSSTPCVYPPDMPDPSGGRSGAGEKKKKKLRASRFLGLNRRPTYEIWPLTAS